MTESTKSSQPYKPGPRQAVAERPAKAPLRHLTSAERKEIPLWSIMSRYFPDALAAVARHSKKANDKHNPGEVLGWQRHKSGDHLECAARHLITPDEIDPDTGELELTGATWRCLAALQLREEKRLIDAGIKPLSGVIAPAPKPAAETDWIPWAGGKCPVPAETPLDVRFRGIDAKKNTRADWWDWRHTGRDGDITAYRVVP